MLNLHTQDIAVAFVEHSLLIFTGLLLFLLAAYIVYSIYNQRWQQIVDSHMKKWYHLYGDYMAGDALPQEFSIPRQCMPCMRETLIKEYADASSGDRELVKNLYVQIGLYRKDLAALDSRKWWHRLHALEQLESMGLKEAEPYVWPLLSDKRNEVRLAAFHLMVSIESELLYRQLDAVFMQSHRWDFRFLVNTLSNKKIPVASLEPLAASSAREYRKAAAILLGYEGNFAAIPLLAVLLHDQYKDTRRESVRSLGIIGGPGALPLILEAGQDPESQIRTVVAGALSGYRQEQAVAMLERLAQDDVFEVRLNAFSSLHRIGEAGKSVIDRYASRYPDLAAEYS